MLSRRRFFIASSLGTAATFASLPVGTRALPLPASQVSELTPRAFGAAGDGQADDGPSFAAAMLSLAGATGTLRLSAGAYRVASDLTVPPNLAIVFDHGARLTTDAGSTVTIGGPLQAPLAHIFDGSGFVQLHGPIPSVVPQWWGARGDGQSHALTALDVLTRPGWKDRYVQGDEWDYVGLQEALTAAFASNSRAGELPTWNGQPNAPLNKEVFIPAGTYLVSGTLRVQYVMGGAIRGAGRFATTLAKVGRPGHLIDTNGFSYSEVRGLHLDAHTQLGPDNALFNLDWDGSRGGGALQSNTFSELYIGGAADYGIKVGASGYMGSENLFQNCFWQGLAVAGLGLFNYNALQNTIVGGNFQGCHKYGVYVGAGSIHLFSTGFQNGILEQHDRDGYDVYIANSANDASSIYSCRSESLRLASATNGHILDVRGLTGHAAASRQWAPSTLVHLDETINGNGGLYRCAAGGMTGETEPAWPGSGSVSDAEALWTLVEFVVLAIGNGIVQNSTLPFGKIRFNGTACAVENCFVSRPDWLDDRTKQLVSAGLANTYRNVQVFRGGGPNMGGGPVTFTVPGVDGTP